MSRRRRPHREHGFTLRRRSAEHGFTLYWRSAENGFTSHRRYAENGFTLLELMIVMAIMGLAAATVSLALPDPKGRLADEALLFGNRVRAAHDAAIVAARPVSVWVSPGGYGFDQRTGASWVSMSDAALRVAQWREGTHALVVDPGGRERVTFDETGLADRPVDIPLTRGRYRQHVRVAVDGSVRIGD
ncbi:MAG: prepilin-type N-terminal cleavage/methylation domain-containing protein [Janthinobacterium lividum]